MDMLARAVAKAAAAASSGGKVTTAVAGGGAAGIEGAEAALEGDGLLTGTHVSITGMDGFFVYRLEYKQVCTWQPAILLFLLLSPCSS
jgi:hypothetical protein